MIRDYQESDFGDCVNLVNKVWEFDKHFAPLELSQLFQRIYTGSALSESNFLKVVEEGGQIRGFLFGKIENQPLPKSEFSSFWGQLKWKWFYWLNVEERGHSDIVEFYRGVGYERI
jgi:hypothetical protein